MVLMNKIVGKGYTFDDLTLVPCLTNVGSRLETDFSTQLTKDTVLSIPIINSPMDSVISFELADILDGYGTYPIFSRGLDIEHYKKIRDNTSHYRGVVVSLGINNMDFVKEVVDLGFDRILFDVANGHTKMMEKAIAKTKKYNDKVEIIAGNVCTGLGYYDLANWGADCVRVGIGPGAACTTRMVTGVGVPQMSAILDIAEEKSKMHSRKVPFIADGGISSSRELCLALAAGADCIMIGKLFALTEESAAMKRGGSKEEWIVEGSRVTIHPDTGIRQAKYRGQASEDYQKDYYGGLKKGTVPEGVDFWAPVTGSAHDVIDSLLGGLRSSMSFLDAKTLNEFQSKARFIEVSNTYMKESKPREN